MPPDKESQIDLDQLNKDLETSARQKKFVFRYVKEDGFFINDYQWAVNYYYYNNYRDKRTHRIAIGNLAYFLDTDANGDQASFKALHGVTIYGNVSLVDPSNVKEPTKEDYDFKLESRWKQKYTMQKITITKKFQMIICIIK